MRQALQRLSTSAPSRPVISLLNTARLPPAFSGQQPPSERIHLDPNRPIQIGFAPSDSKPVVSAVPACLHLRHELMATSQKDVQSLSLLVLLSPESHFDAFNLSTALMYLFKLENRIKHELPSRDFSRALFRLMGMIESREFTSRQLAVALQSIVNSKTIFALVEASPTARADLAQLMRKIFLAPEHTWADLDTTLAGKFMTVMGRLANWKSMPEVRQVFKDFPNCSRIANTAVVPHLTKFSPKELAQVMWSSAQLSKSNDHLLQSIESMLLLSKHKMQTFSERELSIVWWVFAKQYTRPKAEFMALVDATLVNKLPDFYAHQTAKEQASLFWILACLGLANNQHFVQYLDRVVKSGEMAKLDLKGLGSIAWAMATWRHFDPVACEQLAENLTRLAPLASSAESRVVINTLWVFCSLGSRCLQLPKVQQYFEVSFGPRFQVDQQHLDNAKELQQCKLAWQHEFGSTAKLPNALWAITGDWVDRFIRDNSRLTTTTKYSAEILEVCQRLGYKDAIQNCVTSTGFYVDVLVHDNVLVELVPVFGYMSDGKTLTGKQQFKQELIEKEGFRLISIPVRQWKQINVNKSAQLDLMAKLLKPPTTAATTNMA